MAAALCLAVIAAPAEAQSPARPAAGADEREARLFTELQASAWPAELVRLADDYLRAFPRSERASTVQRWQAGAREAAAVLKRPNVHLTRNNFQPANAAAQTDEMRLAARGDKEAAARLAQRYLEGDGVDADLNRYAAWLAFASALGHASASYELAVHFRKQQQPALAAQYETRARELGYVFPTALDNVRK